MSLYRTFSPEPNKIIKIGRSNEAEVSIDDDLLSRFHCFIKFDPNRNVWILNDGCFSREDYVIKTSTNGTWIYLKDDTEIYDDFIFKANQSVFRVHIK